MNGDLANLAAAVVGIVARLAACPSPVAEVISPGTGEYAFLPHFRAKVNASG